MSGRSQVSATWQAPGEALIKSRSELNVIQGGARGLDEMLHGVELLS